MKILLAIDGSSYTQKMLAYLTTHDSLFGKHNEYTLLTVQPPLPPRARAAVGKEIVDSYYAVDLLVMGSHGHSSLGNLIMGSVTTQVLARSKVPVLLVR